jgi:hypothetical protein
MVMRVTLPSSESFWLSNQSEYPDSGILHPERRFYSSALQVFVDADDVEVTLELDSVDLKKATYKLL